MNFQIITWKDNSLKVEAETQTESTTPPESELVKKLTGLCPWRAHYDRVVQAIDWCKDND
jgi:hypothetical protein